jgi:hypothetical protein
MTYAKANLNSLAADNGNNANLRDSSNLRVQLFSLNKLSIEQLRQKWLELYRVNPSNFKRGYLVKGLAYRIQYLYGLSVASDDDVETSLRATKQKLMLNQKTKYVGVPNATSSSSSPLRKKRPKINMSSFNFPVGTVIKTRYKDKEHAVKVLEDNKLSYNNKIYKSLSAIASEASGTRWNGYAFFGLKK